MEGGRDEGLRNFLLSGLRRGGSALANTCIEATGRIGMELGYHVMVRAFKRK